MEDEQFKRDVHELGTALIKEMHKETVKHDAVFVLVTLSDQIHNFCLANDIICLDISRPLMNEKFSLPDTLSHFNESGSGVLAWEITKLLQEKGLVPAEY